MISDLSRRRLLSVAAMTWLLALVVWLFWDHVGGRATFPWDFQGGYYTHAVARMRDGSFLSPPLWLPWGGFGLPGHLSLQDGTWYLPQWLFDFLGWPYDMVGATRLQVVHVALAGVGTWFLGRYLGCSRWACALLGTAAVMSGSFYSNAQHVDVVRGAAMFPWLVWVVAACLKRPGPPMTVLAALVAWQYLVGSYPGQIVAAAYVLSVVVVVVARDMRGADAARGVSWLALAAMFAIGLACIKFLPVAMDSGNIRQVADQLSTVDTDVLTTLLFDYDVPYLGNDVTMRDLFVVLPVLLLAPLGMGLGIAGRVGLALSVVAAFFIVDPAGLAARLPLFSVSRFHLADFRPALHLGLALAAGAGLDALRQRAVPAWRWVFMGVTVLLLVWLSRHAVAIGLNPDSFQRPAWIALASMTGMALAWRAGDARIRNGALGLLLAMAAWSGISHVRGNARVWNTPRSDAQEIAMYGSSIRDMVSVNRYDALVSRPGRIQLEALPLDRAQLYDPRYTRGWLSERFSAFGYDDLKGARTFQYFYDGASTPNSPVHRQIHWLIAPSQLVIADNAPLNLVLDAAERCGPVAACDISGRSDGRVKPLRFFENGEEWLVTAPGPMTVVQNEVWYDGWKSRICRADSTCLEGPLAQDFNGLRRWQLPAGDYRLVTYYRPPGWTLARWISLVSAALLAALALVYFLARIKLLSSRPVR